MDNKIESAKHAAGKMIFYMIAGLVENGCSDPKQVVAQELGEMINLSEDQVRFVESELNSGSKFLKDIQDSIKLIKTKDDKSIDIAVQLLEVVYDMGLNALKEVNLDGLHNQQLGK